MDHTETLRAERNSFEKLIKNEDFLSTFWKWLAEGKEDAIYQMASQKDEKVHVAQGMFKAFEYLLQKPEMVKAEMEAIEKSIEAKNARKQEEDY